MRIIRAVGRYWIPLVIVLVVAVESFVVARVHGIFGSGDHPQYSDSRAAADRPGIVKHVVYEVFGPAGTVARISYLNADSEPQDVDGATLPWSTTIKIDSPSVVANLVAQGNSHSIGCRIRVDDQIKAERVSNEVNAFTHCLVQGA